MRPCSSAPKSSIACVGEGDRRFDQPQRLIHACKHATPPHIDVTSALNDEEERAGVRHNHAETTTEPHLADIAVTPAGVSVHRVQDAHEMPHFGLLKKPTAVFVEHGEAKLEKLSVGVQAVGARCEHEFIERDLLVVVYVNVSEHAVAEEVTLEPDGTVEVVQV